ncbi:MAG: hypothetical protein HQK66_10830, partial [Desulfamplus sp.]|nr:hypothetical protein [Desulfamplus sp.]
MVRVIVLFSIVLFFACSDGKDGGKVDGSADSPAIHADTHEAVEVKTDDDPSGIMDSASEGMDDPSGIMDSASEGMDDPSGLMDSASEGMDDPSGIMDSASEKDDELINSIKAGVPMTARMQQIIDLIMEVPDNADAWYN